MFSSNDPIVTSTGAYLAPPEVQYAARPEGPWSTNANPRAARRGEDVRAALAGERSARQEREEREARTIARISAKHAGASWSYVTHPTAGRVLVSIPDSDRDDVPQELLAELANGRRV